MAGNKFEKASFGERFVAFILDQIFIYLSSTLLTSALFVLMTVVGNNTSLNQLRATWFGGLFIVFLWGCFYSSIFLGWKGTTPGKRIMKMKVLKEDGAKLGYLDAFMREVLGKTVSLIAIFPLGYLWMLWDKNEQTWHDKIAKTIVIKVKK